jgi:phenylpyruvate tautomerase PptA (4-oxalocrotonate tautomerase family)
MPFVRISLLKGKSPAYLAALSDGVQRALVESFDVPATDRFQVIEQCDPEELVFDRDYLGGPRSDDFVLVQVTAGRQRPNELKQAFYRRLVDELGAVPGIRPQDVMVVINVTASEDWSFGGGVAAVDALLNEKETS